MEKEIMPIVTINYNGKDDTIDLLKSLSENSTFFDLIIVDNNSTRENEFGLLMTSIADIFSSPFIEKKEHGLANTRRIFELTISNSKNQFVTLIEACENGGFSKGTNIGLKYSRIKYSNASYCTILNNDTIVTKKFLDTALNVLEGNKTIVAAMGTILYYGYDKPYIWSIGGKINWIKGHGTHVLKNSVFDFSKKYPPYVKRTFVSGCFTIFKTSALEEIKFLDEDYFFAGEEYQYSFDLSKKHLIVWIPNSVIYHKSILEIGNGSSHNIKNIAWQYNAYIVKLLFINKNKSKIYKFFWHISFKMYINCVLKKRYIKSNLYNLKTFLYLRNALFRNINIISFDEKKFNDFLTNLPKEE